MSPKQPAPPFGLPINTRNAVEHLHERIDSTDGRLTELEVEIKERLVRVETNVEAMRDMMIEDRNARNVVIQESGRTERVKYNTRAKIIVALFGVIGVIAGAAATVLAGCV